jgi:hypothetical protein
MSHEIKVERLFFSLVEVAAFRHSKENCVAEEEEEEQKPLVFLSYFG